MEEEIFRLPAVAGILEKSFVEARLHTDGRTNIERILALQQELAQSVATPFYVLVDPANAKKLASFAGSTRDAERFAEFLGRGLQAN